MAHHYVTGIDVGTYQVKVVIASSNSTTSQDPNGVPQIIGTGYAESRGLRNGYIINESDVTRSVRNAVAQAEKASGVKVKHAYISMGGIGLDEVHSHGEAITSRADSVITQADVDKAVQTSEEFIQDKIPNKKILHAIPLQFTVDGERVHGRPHDLKGTKLEVDVLFVTAFEHHLNDLVAAIESIGIKVDDIMASPLAGSLVMLTKAQKRAGCVLANIGAETVSIVVFENNTPTSVKVFPLGSNDITNDIALGLKITLDEAERIKRGGMTNVPYSKKKLDEIISARFSDIFELIDDHLRKMKRDGLLPAGVILTGGGSGITTVQDLARAALRLPSKIATLDPGQNGKVRDASWAVGYGLCIWGMTGTEEESGINLARHTGSSILNWFKQFLP
ncbi:MAG: cell division protein FtsA [Candidatus Pacebacteria bacterium]|nr:cell division protein FtsA [Candidatus Paceibacterota bacterium]MCF7857604.1 cell division protein FtsA [Candidatus Paceibacterota bacterium]